MVGNSELQRVELHGWRTGLANLLRKEGRAWWRSRRWLVQGLLWAVVVNGFVAFALFLVPLMAEITGAAEAREMDPLASGVQALFQIGTMALAAGAIVLVQDAIIGERQLGVTEWLLSKPLSRSAYVLSKLLAHGLGILVILVGLQGAIAYSLLSLAGGEPFPLTPYLVGMLGLALHTLFYLALTLMMGVLTDSRNILLGVSLGTLLGGLLIAGLLGNFAMLTPWSLVAALPATVSGAPLPMPIWLPIGVTAALSLLFVAVALCKFRSLEF
jgi:ABC-2 type transport system permease protein